MGLAVRSFIRVVVMLMGLDVCVRGVSRRWMLRWVWCLVLGMRCIGSIEEAVTMVFQR